VVTVDFGFAGAVGDAAAAEVAAADDTAAADDDSIDDVSVSFDESHKLLDVE
jgi:hypothetical protein